MVDQMVTKTADLMVMQKVLLWSGRDCWMDHLMVPQMVQHCLLEQMMGHQSFQWVLCFLMEPVMVDQMVTMMALVMVTLKADL